MSWREMPLGEFLTLKRGYDLPSSQREDGEVPVVSSSGITGYHNVAKVEGPGVVTGRYGTLGEVFFIDQDFWPLNTALYVQDFKGNEPRFTAYFLTRVLKGTSSDKAAVPGVNRNDLHARTITVTTNTNEQQRIAAILSAYDDLIENNRRRIQLLEEAARLLYREWFVHLRFPGHEHVAVVDGVPGGWERKKVSELVERIPAGRLYDQKTALDEGMVPILDQGKSGLIGYHNDEPSIVASQDAPVIVFANHTCYQRIVHYPFSAIQNVLPFVPSSKTASDVFWLHYATNGLVKLNAYKGHWPEFMAKETLLPPPQLCQQFGEVVRDNHLMMDRLEVHNKRLAKARDLLLPRLMNGEISV